MRPATPPDDAGGELLIRSTENGERVLYAGTTELHLRPNGTTWTQRQYGSDGLTVVRSNQTGSNELTYLAGDHHGTQTLADDATDQTYVKRYFTSFGDQRGETTGGAWPTGKGFLGKTTDTTTGLTGGAPCPRIHNPRCGEYYVHGRGGRVSRGEAQRLQNQAYHRAQAQKAIQAAEAAERVAKERSRADAQRTQAEKGFWETARDWTTDTFGTRDGRQNRVLPAVGFGACLVVSAGMCVVAGVTAATVAYGGDRLRTGEFDGAGYAKTLAWTAGGGLVAGGAARAMGAVGWRGAFWGNAIARAKVRVPTHRTKLGYGTGPGGGRKGFATQPG
ncbi:hypothetical protein [Streptomyces sp. NBC_00872]|uniref:hypothetical protein n=1 Tax=Streptomyces sp. NBC_00872 TaxID=2903686 RepID=UPI00386B2B3A